MSKARRPVGAAAASRAGRRKAIAHAPTRIRAEKPSGTDFRPPAPDTLKRALGIKLIVIARQLGNRFDHAVERDGLTRAKWSVVAAVARMPGATQRSIAAALEVTEVTAGQLIDKLCSDGYLERRENPKDRRAYCVHLTKASQPLLLRLGEIAKEHEEETFAGVSEAELAQLDALLEAIARNLADCRSRPEEKKSLGLPVGAG